MSVLFELPLDVMPEKLVVAQRLCLFFFGFDLLSYLVSLALSFELEQLSLVSEIVEVERRVQGNQSFLKPEDISNVASFTVGYFELRSAEESRSGDEDEGACSAFDIQCKSGIFVVEDDGLVC